MVAPPALPTFLYLTHNAVGCSVPASGCGGSGTHAICSSAAISERLTEPSALAHSPGSYEETEEEETRLDGLHRELVSASRGAA